MTTTAPSIDPATLDAFREGIPAGPNHDTKTSPAGTLTSYVPTTDPAVFLTITTRHHGRAQYVGPIEYAITSSVNAERRERTDSGGTVTRFLPFSARSLGIVRDVKRRTAKNMREAHAAACAEVAAMLAADPDALAGVLAVLATA